LTVLVGAAESQAGGKIAIDETKWISIGVGLRGSMQFKEDQSPNGDDWSKDFNVDNTRIYLNGQIHKYLKFEVNTECTFCSSSMEKFALLDGIAKIEINQYLNIWGGRLLVPAERQEMNGPFYSSTYDRYRTPFFPSDFSTTYGTGGAGVYGRDNGLNIWGAAGPNGAFQYVVGFFSGLQSAAGNGPNQDDNLLYAARVAYNFLNVEKNPGYYTSGEYFGTAGDILTLGVAVQHQGNGSGSFDNPGDFTGVSVDLLYELVLEDAGVFDFDGEYKHFDSDYNSAAFTDGTGNFGMFDGDSFSLVGLYLIDKEVGIGRFQPYVRYTGIYPNGSNDRDEVETGLNYVIDGFNARVSLWYQYGDIRTKGLNYAPTAPGDKVSAVGLGIQLQI